MINLSVGEDKEFIDDDLGDEELDALKEMNDADMDVENIRESLHKVFQRFDILKHVLFIQRSKMQRDLRQARANITRVDMWSIIHLFVCFIISIIQVFMVRQLFSEKSILMNLKRKLFSH